MVIGHLQKKNSNTYYSTFKSAVVDHLQKKNSKPYNNAFKTAATRLQYEQTYCSGFQIAIIGHLKYKKYINKNINVTIIIKKNIIINWK